MAGVEFRLLGTLQLLVDGAPVKLPGSAERSLLALLLLAPGRTVPATSLIDRLWGETDLPRDPANALQLRVSKLRRALGPHDVEVTRDGSGYRVEVDPDRVDLHRFARCLAEARAWQGGATRSLLLYDQALALWAGDPLADFAGAVWASVEAARLQQLRVAAVTERAELALQSGRHVEVVGDLGPLVAGDPTHEALAGLLMTALYRGGRQADALDVFDRTRRRLDDELGLQPSAALRALHQRVLQQDPTLTDGGSAATRPSPPVPPGTAPRRVAPPFPVPTVRLLGRDADLASVRELLTEQRMVTLVGPGGAGKTSLALEVAHGLADVFGNRALVRLAPVTRPGDVPLAVADALGVPLDGADPRARVRDRLLSFLAGRDLLLVLDNCEHVIDATARLASDVLTASTGVTVLATSREALAIPGELQVAVGPLEVPPPGTASDRVLDYPAARLFVDRATAVRPGLRLGSDELQALSHICCQLDGIPLALELAAARISSLSLVELADRLHDRFGLLTRGPRTADARQRTLRATVDWSHDLLGDAERRVFRRLAVFSGGWTLPAAETVVAGNGVDPGEVLDVLARLVDRSMVVPETGHPTRYRMLETLRQYAAEQLEQYGEQEAVSRRHALFFRDLAEDADRGLRGPGQRETLHRLREEHANLRVALAWLSAAPDRVEDALRLAGSLGLFWHLGRHLEGREALRRLVAVPGGSVEARARALQAVSLVERPRACLVHPSPVCAATAQDSLNLFVAAGDAHRAALSRVLLAVELLDGSDPARFETLLGEAERQFDAETDEWGHAVVAFVRLQHFLRRGEELRARSVGRAAADAFRRLDDAWGLSAVLYHLGWGLKEFGRYADAVPVLEHAVEVAESAGMFNTAQWAQADLGTALLHLSQADAALSCFDRARRDAEEIGDAAGNALASLGEAVLAQIRDDVAVARSSFEEALAGLERLGTPLWAGQALAGVGWCDWRDGLLDEARERYTRVLAMGEALGEPALTAGGLEGLARVAAGRGHLAQAAADLSRAAGVRRSASRPAPPHEQAELSALMRVVPRTPGRPGAWASPPRQDQPRAREGHVLGGAAPVVTRSGA